MGMNQEMALLIGEKLRDLATDQDVIPYDTGELMRSHIVVPQGVNGAMLSAGRPYAKHVFYGIRGIKPVRAKALRFKAPKGWRGKVSKGGYVFLKSVGPRAPRPWMLVAIRNLKSGGFGFVANQLKKKIILGFKK